MASVVSSELASAVSSERASVVSSQQASLFTFFLLCDDVCDDDILLQVSCVQQLGGVPAGEVVEAAEGDGDEDGQGCQWMKWTILEGQ